MIILGIDPGTTSIGYAVIDSKETVHIIEAGLISLKNKSKNQLIKSAYKQVRKIIKERHPVVLAIERLFFAKNTKTALLVSEFKGIILLTAALSNLTIYEYTPREVKMALTGDGTADKKQIEKMIKLTVPETNRLKADDDVFDAIAVALTCSFLEKF